MPKKIIRRSSGPKGHDRAAKAGSVFSAGMGGSNSNFMSNTNYLNDILYRGRENRLQRYRVYDQMDRDTDIARALDIIAEHCTNKDSFKNSPFNIKWKDDDQISLDDTSIINDLLDAWSNLNDWDNRLFRMVRNVVKYGDAFFIRDPNDFLLRAISASQVVGIYVDEEKDIVAYHIRDLEFFHPDIMVDAPSTPTQGGVWNSGSISTGSNRIIRKDVIIAAEHVIHLSLSEGQFHGGTGENDDIWPFGESFLEQIYKEYRIRDMLENAVLIHRIQRAPSRLVWTIPVGRMRGDKVNSVLNKFKNERLHKRVPSRSGGDQGAVDSIYNPVSQMEDIYLPAADGGQTPSVNNLEGQQWNGLKDLEYFTSKVMRGLRVPMSYMLGPEEGGSNYGDGKVGIAYMEEIEFSRFCIRIQDLLDNTLDMEFKTYMKVRGMNVHSADFELKFILPSSFEEYRDGEINKDRLERVRIANDTGLFSKRFALAKFGNFTKDEIMENERLWQEENKGTYRNPGNPGSGVGSLPSLGGFDGFDSGPSFGQDDFSDLGDDGGLGGNSFDPGAEDPFSGGGGGGQFGGQGPTSPGFESIKNRKSGVIMEDAITPPEVNDMDRSKSPVSDDKFSSGNTSVPLTLSRLNKMRMKREAQRKEYYVRMNLVPKLYGASSNDSNPF